MPGKVLSLFYFHFVFAKLNFKYHSNYLNIELQFKTQHISGGEEVCLDLQIKPVL